MAGRDQGGLKCKLCGKWKVSGSPCTCPNPDWEPSKFESPSQKNSHPTVKPLALMRYLCRLITPPNGTILDPFAGSGSTGIAAMKEGFNSILIEIEQESADIARLRIKGATKE
jgi:site-specific DNA-methyltransferase (adenine-specific)